MKELQLGRAGTCNLRAYREVAGEGEWFPLV